VAVRAERHRGAVAELFGELDDRQPVFVDAQAREAVPQVVPARAEAAGGCQRLELAGASSCSRAVARARRPSSGRSASARAALPRDAARAGRGAGGRTGRSSAAAARSSAAEDLAVDVLLLDEQRALTDVTPLEGERLLRSHAGVRELSTGPPQPGRRVGS